MIIPINQIINKVRIDFFSFRICLDLIKKYLILFLLQKNLKKDNYTINGLEMDKKRSMLIPVIVNDDTKVTQYSVKYSSIVYLDKKFNYYK